jgi:hypothetical protein
LVESRDDIGGAAIAVVEEVQAAAGFSEFLVVEKVDIFEVSVKGEKEFCMGS